MEESSVYQAILRKGEGTGSLAEARRLLLLLGSKEFGDPDTQIVDAIDSMVDLHQLEQLALQASSVASWQELVEPTGRRSRRRRT